MSAFDFIASAVYLLIAGLALRWLLRHLPGGRAKQERPPLPYRSRNEVLDHVNEHRAKRDLDTCRAIWPDPPSARVIEAQYRHDTAKQRKENGK